MRALGETDLNPVSGIGKISQLLFAVLQPNNGDSSSLPTTYSDGRLQACLTVVANIIAGGVAEAGAQQAGDLMQE